MATNLTTAQLWNDIIAAHRLEAPPEGAMCVTEFAKRINKSEKHSRDLLNALAAQGKLGVGEFKRPDGKRATYYWPLEGEVDNE